MAKRGTEFEIVAVGVQKVDRFGGHPRMEYGAFVLDAAFIQMPARWFDILLVYCEREMLHRPIGLILLQYDHSRGTAGSKEYPLSRFVAQSNSQTKYLPIKQLGG